MLLKKPIARLNRWLSKVTNQLYSPWPILFHTVDIAAIRHIEGNSDYPDDIMVLLGRKPHKQKYQLIGGFTDVVDKSTIVAARREFCEETGIMLPAQYEFIEIGQYPIDDSRYINTPHSVLTHYYTVDVTDKDPNEFKPHDDIAELEWFSLNDLSLQWIKEEHVIHQHHYLIDALLEFYYDKRR